MLFQESIDILSTSLQPGTCTTATALTALIMQKNRIISNVYYALLKMASRPLDEKNHDNNIYN
jgi:hypothetical protein